jgi:hypothetical protein
VVEYPQHVIDLVLLHYPVSFEAILPPSHLANPISLAFHAIHYLLLAPLLNVRDEPDSVLRRGPIKTGVGSRWDKWEEEGKVKGRGLGGGWTVRRRIFNDDDNGVEIPLDTTSHRSLPDDSLCQLNIPIHAVSHL